MDFITDKSQRVVKFVKSACADKLPEGVAEYPQQITEQALATYPRSAFADPVRREYPLINKSAALWSALYAHVRGEPRDSVVARVKQACDNFGVTDQVNELVSYMQGRLEKSAHAKTLNYALVLEDGDKELRYYPINDTYQLEESAKQACTDLNDGRLPLELFVDASLEITKAASAAGMEDRLPQLVQQYGTQRVANLQDIHRALSKRAAYTGDNAYTMLIDVLPTPHEASWELVKQAADLTYRLDQENAVEYTNGNFRDPYSSFFSGDRVEELRKEASNYFLLDDLPLPYTVLADMDDREISIWCDPESQEAVKSARDSVKQASAATPELDHVMDTLPEETKSLFVRYLNGKFNS